MYVWISSPLIVTDAKKLGPVSAGFGGGVWAETDPRPAIANRLKPSRLKRTKTKNLAVRLERFKSNLFLNLAIKWTASIRSGRMSVKDIKLRG